MVAACYRAGASAVIAGPGPNYAAGKRVVGTDLLVKWLLYGLRLGLGPKRALQMARMRLKATSWRGPDRDALAFKIQQREV
ncbi:MAG: hypothetical protein GTO22_20710 [Gemmatimonadales bacterium]|nr:hypothetical protein [Gemmatimonadales bacterium]